VTWVGPDDERKIADQTNPWVEINGEPYDWTKFIGPRLVDPCGEGFLVVVAGVLDAMDACEGVQRCDACQRFEGDLYAAAALAELVGGTVRFEVAE
jgi:cytochrome b involved in lipid metabolism